MVREERQHQSPRPDWLKPGIEQHSLRQYLTTLRQRAWVVVLMVLVTTGAAAAYVATAEKVYEAQADVLVTPIPGDDTLLRGLGLISTSADPEREIETVARLISARNAEDRVEVSAEPVAASNIVALTAEAPDPQLARQAANDFARAAIEVRTEQFQAQLERAISTLQNQIASAEDAGAPIPVGELARLKALRGRPDPTLRLEVGADSPESATWPKPKLSIAVGLLAGLVLGIGAVFLWQLLDPRLRREEDLKEMFGLPILARIPSEGLRIRHRGALGPSEISPATLEAFRTLRFTLVAAQESLKGGGSLFVTGPSPSEGKTTTCINLAASLASMGHRVILIEADLRRPAIGKALGITADPHGVASVMVGWSSISDALVTPDGFDGNLRVLLADEQGEWMADQLSLPAARELVSQAEDLAEFVIIDSPPVTDVTDTLPLAREADDILLVVRLGKSRRDELEELGELLAHQEMQPLGIVLVGVSRGRSDYYYTSPTRRMVTRRGRYAARRGADARQSDRRRASARRKGRRDRPLGAAVSADERDSERSASEAAAAEDHNASQPEKRATTRRSSRTR